MGEFGATIMFAGSLQGVTQTLPLAIYAQLGDDFDLALALGAVLVIVSGVILFVARLLVSWTASTSISHSRAATSSSR
jgi:molybdate transport system permease protein